MVVPEEGPGTFTTAPASADHLPWSGLTYRVEVEDGLPFDAEDFAEIVDATLQDPRGWATSSDQPLIRTDSAEAALRIVLASPAAADELCAPLDTDGRLSCRNGANVVINAWRWANGAESYRENLRAYRRYVINHETGHALGHPHASCPRPGALAPVMVQQTLGLQGCRPNPWPALVDAATTPP